MRTICAAAAEHNIAVCVGFSENDKNSLYIAQAIISATGEIQMARRKLKPTHMERTVFGDATGNSLQNVIDIEGIGRVGALACWEHTQPLLKYHSALLREDIQCRCVAVCIYASAGSGNVEYEQRRLSQPLPDIRY